MQERPLKRIKKYDADYEVWNEQFQSDTDEEQPGSNELTQYFSSARHKGDALEYWKTNQYIFPVLSAMARDFLPIQA